MFGGSESQLRLSSKRLQRTQPQSVLFSSQPRQKQPKQRRFKVKMIVRGGNVTDPDATAPTGFRPDDDDNDATDMPPREPRNENGGPFTDSELATLLVPSSRDIKDSNMHEFSIPFMKIDESTAKRHLIQLWVPRGVPTNPLSVFCDDIVKNSGHPRVWNLPLSTECTVYYTLPRTRDRHIADTARALLLANGGTITDCMFRFNQQQISFQVVRSERESAARQRSGGLIISRITANGQQVADPRRYLTESELNAKKFDDDDKHEFRIPLGDGDSYIRLWIPRNTPASNVFGNFLDGIVRDNKPHIWREPAATQAIFNYSLPWGQRELEKSRQVLSSQAQIDNCVFLYNNQLIRFKVLRMEYNPRTPRIGILVVTNLVVDGITVAGVNPK